MLHPGAGGSTMGDCAFRAYGGHIPARVGAVSLSLVPVGAVGELAYLRFSRRDRAG